MQLPALCTNQHGLSITIGEAHAEQEMHAGRLIAQSYRLDDQNLGTLAIFRPQRMDYQKIIGIVNSTANHVSQILSSKRYKGA